MIGARELTSSLYGAFRLASLHKDGLAFFNPTPEGFWRSFFAAALVAPGYLALTMIEPGSAGETVNPFHDALVDGLAYAIGWVAFPLAMVPVARLLAREERYIPYIVAYNWAAVPQMMLFVGAAIVTQGLALGSMGAGLIGLAAAGAILTYYWFIARTALNIPGQAAAGVVALDVTITIVISALATLLTGAAAG
jgi:hypothetical protein